MISLKVDNFKRRYLQKKIYYVSNAENSIITISDTQWEYYIYILHNSVDVQNEVQFKNRFHRL